MINYIQMADAMEDATFIFLRLSNEYEEQIVKDLGQRIYLEGELAFGKDARYFEYGFHQANIYSLHVRNADKYIGKVLTCTELIDLLNEDEYQDQTLLTGLTNAVTNKPHIINKSIKSISEEIKLTLDTGGMPTLYIKTYRDGQMALLHRLSRLQKGNYLSHASHVHRISDAQSSKDKIVIKNVSVDSMRPYHNEEFSFESLIDKLSKDTRYNFEKEQTEYHNGNTIIIFITSTSGKIMNFMFYKPNAPSASAASPFRPNKSRRRGSKSVKRRRKLRSKSKSRKRSSKPRPRRR